MTYQLVWTPDVARWSWNRNDYIHIYIPSVQELSGFHPIVASQERKHGAKNCSLGTATQRGGDPKNYVVSQRTPQMTSNNPNFQRSWNSSRVSQGWNTMKPSSTWLSNKNHGTLFQNPNNRASPGEEFHISKLELVKLSQPQSYQRVTHDIAGLRSLPTILWLRWSTHWPISFESWVVFIDNQDLLQPRGCKPPTIWFRWFQNPTFSTEQKKHIRHGLRFSCCPRNRAASHARIQVLATPLVAPDWWGQQVVVNKKAENKILCSYTYSTCVLKSCGKM